MVKATVLKSPVVIDKTARDALIDFSMVISSQDLDERWISAESINDETPRCQLYDLTLGITSEMRPRFV